MFSMTKTSKDNLLQSEVHLESKDTSIIMKKSINIAAFSLENCQITNDSYEIKTKQKNLKESEKQEKMQIEIESSEVSKSEYQQMKPTIAELKNIEFRVEKLKTEDKESKSFSDITLHQTNVPEYKMIPIADKFVSFIHNAS